MCILWNFYAKNLGTPRFTWMGGRELGAGAPPEGDWEEPDLDSAYDKEKKAGRGRGIPPFELPPAVTPGPSPGPEKPKSIDPGQVVVDKHGRPMEKLEDRFPQLRTVVQKLYEIGNEKFWAYKNDMNDNYAADYKKMAKKMPEAMLYKAIVENWSMETLYDEYGKVMGDLATKAASKPLLDEILGLGKRAWHGVFKSKNLGQKDPNPAIEGKRKISLNEIDYIDTRMSEISRELIEGDNVCVEWKGKCKDWEDKNDEDDFDGKRLKFIKEEMLPFYMELFLNKGIVENRTAEEILWTWAECLAGFAHSCEIP